MGRDRHSKSTERFDEQQLQQLAGGATAQRTAQRAGATIRRAPVHEIRPTCKIHKDELLGLIDRASRPATDPGPREVPPDLEVEMQVFDPDQVKKARTTQRSRAKLFQLIVRAKEAGIPVTAEELEALSDDEAQALFDARAAQLRQIVDGTPPSVASMARGSEVARMPVAKGSMSPEVALDLLEQGISEEPPELQQSERPFAHSIQLEPDLAAEVARRRKASPTAPLSPAELAAAATAAHQIATGEIEPIRLTTPPTDPTDARVLSRPLAVEASRDFYLLVALAAAIVAFTVMFALMALR